MNQKITKNHKKLNIDIPSTSSDVEIIPITQNDSETSLSSKRKRVDSMNQYEIQNVFPISKKKKSQSF